MVEPLVQPQGVTNLVAVGLWRQPLVQRSHLCRQILESIPEFFLLTNEKQGNRSEE